MNISYLEVELNDTLVELKKQFGHDNAAKLTAEEMQLFKEKNKRLFEYKNLKDNMHITALPLYKNIEIEFNRLHILCKSDYRQISPFCFNEGIKKSDNWSNENQNIIIFDIDDGLSLSEAKEKFKDNQYLIYTTKSHQVDKKGLKCDRFRIILPAIYVPSGDFYFEVMRKIEDRMPYIDKQVNTKTGAFLGNSNCEYWYNDGKPFDFRKYIDMVENEKSFNRKIAPANNSNVATRQKVEYTDSLPIEEIKELLTREVTADIVSSLGYEVNRKFMFKYRLDERSPSASISNNINPLIKDFGSDLSCDCIGFVQEVKHCSFREAVEYVGSFTNVQNS